MICSKRRCSNEVENTRFKQCASCRKEAAAGTEAYRQRQAEKQDSSTCTTAGCTNERDGRFKRCRPCLDRAAHYKNKYRAQPKAENVCSVSDCQNETDGRHRHCARCRRRQREYANRT